MKAHTLLLLYLIVMIWGPSAYCNNEPPIVRNTKLRVNVKDNIIVVDYDLWDDKEKQIKVDVRVSTDGGNSFLSGIRYAGDVGYPVITGKFKSISVFCPAMLKRAAIRVWLIADDLQPVDVRTLADDVDTAILAKQLNKICGPRSYNDEKSASHLQAVTSHIEQEFLNNALLIRNQDILHEDVKGRNIIGVSNGSDTGSIFVVGAHFDTVKESPGADDNGSGLIAMLEIARIVSKYSFEKSIHFVAFDLEEKGHLGSIAYVKNALKDSASIHGMINFDMIGYFSEQPNSQVFPQGMDQLFPEVFNTVSTNKFRGDFVVSAANERSQRLSLLFDSCAHLPYCNIKTASLVLPGNGEIAPDLRRSDHAAFWDAGIEGLYLGDGANTRNPHYHSATDLPTMVSLNKVAAIVRATIVLLSQSCKIKHCSTTLLKFN